MPTETPPRRGALPGEVPPRTLSGAQAGPLRFGPYFLEARIAVGGTAEVYLARPIDPADGRTQVVVKRLLPHFVNDPEGRTMFDREAKLHAAVQHENVVSVYGAGQSVEGEPYLAMEYIEGVDCFRLLRRMTQAGRPLAPGIGVYVAREVLRALQSVHSARDEKGQPLGIIHRDVTPSNIYLGKDGRVKLGDFGIARSSSRATLKTTEATMLKGKFAYLAPEQVAGEPFDSRADLFSLATVLVEMLIGKALFSGSGQLSVLLAIRDCRLDPVIEAKPKLPPGMFELLQTALARDPKARFQTASAFASALLPFQTDTAAAKRELAELVGWAQTTTSTSAMAAVRESARAMRKVSAPPPLPPRRPLGLPTPPIAIRPYGPEQGASAANARRLARKVEEITLDVEPDDDTSETTPDSKLGAHLAARRAASIAASSDGGIDVDVDGGDENERDTGEYSRLPSYVETARGVRQGPWTFARLVEQLATGGVGRDDKVDYMGQGLRPIGEIEELVRFIPAKTANTNVVSGLGTPDIAADLATASMVPVLLQILAAKETGVLFVEKSATDATEAGRKELYFVDGRLHHVASSNAGELLGQYLVRRGMLSRDELDFALAVLPRYGGRIGDTLISLGLVSAVDMFRAIRDQGRDRVADLFQWAHGRATFFRNQTAPHVEFPLELDTPSLLLAGLAAAMPDDAANDKLKALDGSGARVALSPRDGSPLQNMTWPEPVGRVLRLLTAPQTVRELVAAATRDGAVRASDVVRALELLGAAKVATVSTP